LSHALPSEAAPRAGISDLARLTGPQSWRIALAALFMGIGAMATASYAFLVGPVLAALFEAANPAILGANGRTAGLEGIARLVAGADEVVIPLLIVAVAAAKGISFFAQRAFTIAAGQRVLAGLRSRMYRGLLALNPLDPVTPTQGELVSRFTVDAQTVEGAVTDGLLGGLSDGLQLIALACLALALDPLLAILGFVAFPPAALLIQRLGRALRGRKRLEYDASSAMGDTVGETGAGLLVIRAFGAQGLMAGRFERRNRGLMARASSSLLVRAFSSPLNELLGAAALGAAIWYSRARISNGLLSPDELVSFFTALVLLYRPVKGLGQAQHAVQTGLAALDRLRFLVADRPAGEPGRPSGERRRARAPRVELRGVCAGYGDGPDVLSDLHLAIGPSERLALVGPSGAGKSTLLHVLLGLLPTRRGSILVDDRPITDDRAGLAAVFAPVPQEPFLFDDDLETNVRCGRPEATSDEVTAACRAAGVMEFAGTLPGGLAAPVSRSTAAWSQRMVLLEAGAIQVTGLPGQLLDGHPRVVRLFGGLTESDEEE